MYCLDLINVEILLEFIGNQGVVFGFENTRKEFFFLSDNGILLTYMSAVSRNILLTTESASIRLFPGRMVLFVFVKSDSESLAKKIMLSTANLM